MPVKNQGKNMVFGKTFSTDTTDFITKRRKRHLITDLCAHFVLTSLLAAAVYFYTRRPAYAAAAILGGIFIDLDHFVDYFLRFGFRFSPKDLFYGTALSSGKIYVPLHSWEIIFFILCLGIFLRSGLLLVFFLGAAIHLGIDSLQRKNPRVYFLTYRLMKKFDADTLLPETFKECRSR